MSKKIGRATKHAPDPTPNAKESYEHSTNG
jgi:hypothetical protein